MHQQTVLHDARTNLTPFQRQQYEERTKRLQRIYAASHPDMPLVRVSAPEPEPILELEGPQLDCAIDPRLTFASFVVGATNRIAAAAIEQLTNSRPGEFPPFNPFLVYSMSGLGKTHLLQSTAAGSVHRKAIYLTAERFTSTVYESVASGDLAAFRKAISSYDTVIIDDINLLKGAVVREEIDSLLNTMVARRRQLIFAADRPPNELGCFDEKFRSRLASGLALEIQPFTTEMRSAIFAMKFTAAFKGGEHSNIDESLIAILANGTAAHSGREIEGIANAVIAHARFGCPVTHEIVERIINELGRPQAVARIRIEEIQRACARHFNVTKNDILSHRRTKEVVIPRQVAMFLSKKLTTRSLPEIGRRFGNRDHTTALSAIRKIDRLCNSDKEFAEKVAAIELQIKDGMFR